MKKILYFLILLFVPVVAKASYGIENYRIDINVLDTGDLFIQEAFKMNGIYNGFERKINYKNNFANYYGSSISSTKDATIYNGSGVILNDVRAINFDLTSGFFDFIKNGDGFTKSDSAIKGDYGVYVIKKDADGEKYIIYNPNYMNKDFYLSYTLENMAIVHDDVGELELNVFSDMEESISNLEIYIHVPNNENLFKIWGHGFSDGSVEIIDKKTAKIIVNELKKESKIDFRIVFDKNILSKSKKYTGFSVLSDIINIEEKLNKETNKEKDEKYNTLKNKIYTLLEKAEKTKNRSDYEQAITGINRLKTDDFKRSLQERAENLLIKIEKIDYIKKIVYTTINLLWLMGFLVFLLRVYLKGNKGINDNIINDLPHFYNPSVIGFLFKRKINLDDLISSIMYLNNKSIKFEKIKQDYKIIKIAKSSSDIDNKLLKFIFDGESEIMLGQLNIRASNDYDNFITAYSNWINKAIFEAESLKFYDEKMSTKIFGIIYSITGILIGFSFIEQEKFISSWIVIMFASVLLIVFLIINKMTKYGRCEKIKWIKFRKKIISISNNDIEKLNKLDVEQYLIYSINLKCFDQVAKNILNLINSIKENDSIKLLIELKPILKKEIKRSLKIAYNAKDINNYQTKNKI